MNILYVITKSERGGAQQHVLDLAVGFASRGNQVTVAIGEQNGWLHEQLHQKKIPIEHVRLIRTWNPLFCFLYLFDLSKVIRQTRPDVIHFHSSHALVGTWLTRCFFPSIKSVVTIHGLSILHPGTVAQWKQHLYAFFLKTDLRCADQVICVCGFDRDTLVKQNLVDLKRTMIIHNGIAVPNFLSKEEARAKLGLNRDIITIGTLARFSYQKNISFLIEAFAKWNHPSVILCLIGNGSEENVLKQRVIDLHLQDRVVFVQGDATLLKACSLFVLSSRYEGFPYVLLEAAQAEVPIIATNVGGVSELIEQNKTGWLIPSGDVNALVSAIQTVVSDPNRSDLCAQAAAERVRVQFTTSKMIQKIEELYRSTK